MIHLTPADYRRQPWKNGRGTTTELWRRDAGGVLVARLSRAAVTEDGPFSLFPGVERNLTVLSGPGFRLRGAAMDLRCDLLVPVAFPGDLALTASETGGRPSDDFNVMTARSLPRPSVTLVHEARFAKGDLLALYALGRCSANEISLRPEDLVLTIGPLQLTGGGPAIAVRFHGLSA